MLFQFVRQRLMIDRALCRFMPVGPTGFEHDNADAEHDGHIRNIEDPSPERTDSNIDEVDDRSVNDPSMKRLAIVNHISPI
jgi:hypothetical protein